MPNSQVILMNAFEVQGAVKGSNLRYFFFLEGLSKT